MKKMKIFQRALFFLLALALAVPFSSCGKETVVPEGDLTAEVVGSGSAKGFEYNEYSDGTVGITRYTGGYTRHTVPAEIDGKQVSRIEAGAYKSCGLVKLTIPDSVIYIGDSAFEQNGGLEKVDMSDNCKYIGEKAFYACRALKTVDIPDCLKYVGAYAFTMTKWLDSRPEDFVIVGDGILLLYHGNDYNITVPEGVKFISTAFSALNGKTLDEKRRMDSVTLPDGLETIGDYAFSCCTYLKSIDIPDSVTSVGKAAFEDCQQLSEIKLSKNVARIEAYTFSGCVYLEEYTVPEGIEYVGAKAFSECNFLEKLVIGKDVAYFDISALDECTALAELSVDPENRFYFAEDLCLYSADKTELFYYHTYKTESEFTVPESVETVGDRAFAGNTSLKEVVCSGSLVSLGKYCFEGCTSLEYITLPASLSSVGTGAFSSGVSLMEIFYSGTREQWAQISVGISNDAFLQTYVNYEFPGEQ